MVKVRENLVGRQFNKLTVIEQVEDYVKPNGIHCAQWLCECSCTEHNKVVVRGDLLKGSLVQSCGCSRKSEEYKPRLKRRKYNNYDLESKEYGIGYTSKGEPFWFDKEDYDKIKYYCWYYNQNGYVAARERNVIGNDIILLHRIVMEPIPDGKVVDHKKHPVRNGHKIDNRKSNLEIVTQSDNIKNQGMRTDNTSGVTGVYWSKKYNKWLAKIMVDNKEIHLGYFSDKKDAIQARKSAEVKYFGEHRYDAHNA